MPLLTFLSGFALGVVACLLTVAWIGYRQTKAAAKAAAATAPTVALGINDEWLIVRRTPNFTYCRHITDADNRIAVQTGKKKGDKVDTFWIETGVWSKPALSPLED